MVKSGADRKPGSGYSITQERIDAARDTVIKLAQLGCSNAEIGSIVDLSMDTIRRYFQDDLDKGRNNMRASIRKAQLSAAINDKNPTMLIWMGKCYLGQREPRQNHSHEGTLSVEKVVYSSTEEEEKECQTDSD